MQEQKNSTKNLFPIWCGLASSVLVALILSWAVSKEPQTGIAGIVIAPVLAAGMVASAFAALRLRALLIGTLIGLIVGAASASQLLAQPMTHPFLPAIATLGFFVLLGFIIGGMVEFSLFIHHLAHGGTPTEYPPS